MDTVLLGSFVTGLFAAIVALITVRGQMKAQTVAAKAELNKLRNAENQAIVDNWKNIAADAKAENIQLRKERDEAVHAREDEHAVNLALTALNERLTAENTRLKEQNA